MTKDTSKINFKSTVVERKPCSITIDVEVDESAVSHEIENAFNQIKKDVKVAGFRQGKVTMDIIKQRFLEQAKDKALDNIVKDTLWSALDNEAFVIIDEPVIKSFDYNFGKILKYNFSAQCHPKVKITGYKGIPVKKEIFNITEANIIEVLDRLRKRNVKFIESKENEVKVDSFVNVDYEAFDSDGVAIAGVAEKECGIDLSSDNNTLKCFKDALVGAKKGDIKDAKENYPEDYPNEILAGKTVSFKVKIVEVKEKQLQNLNDDFAKDMGMKDLEHLKNKVKESLDEEEKYRQKIDVEKQIINYLLEKNIFEIPSSLVTNRKNLLMKQFKSYMQKQGASESYIEKHLESSDKFLKDAEDDIRLYYILNKISETENIAVTDVDLEAEKNKLKASNPGQDAPIDKYFAHKGPDVISSLKEEKLLKFLAENAKINVEQKDMPLSKN